MLGLGWLLRHQQAGYIKEDANSRVLPEVPGRTGAYKDS
jgi:hypothetical protein